MKQLFIAALLCLVGCAHAAGVRVPPFERVVLPNGATLVLMERHDLPLIAFEAVVRGGANADSEGRSGTANLLANLLEKGAGTRSAAEFAETVDRVGGRITTGAEQEYVSISGSFLARDHELMIELLADMLQRPTLDRVEFDKLRARQIEFIRAAKEANLADLAPVYGAAALLPSHPYGRPVSGSESSLARIDLNDVRAFQREQMGADRLIVSVAGDFELRAMQRLLTRALAGWRRAEQPLPSIPVPEAAKERRVLLVDAPQSTQSYFWLGAVGVAKTDPRRAALDATNSMFGGRYMSLLNAELRVRSGLTYGANSRFERFAQPGYWYIRSFTRSETTTQAIDLALEMLQRLHTHYLSDAELASGRQYIKGQFPLALQTAQDWAETLAVLELYGLDRGYIEGYFDAIDRVDAPAARAAVDGAFPAPERVQIVVIGPAAALRDRLGKYGAVIEMKLTDPEFTPRLR